MRSGDRGVGFFLLSLGILALMMALDMGDEALLSAAIVLVALGFLLFPPRFLRRVDPERPNPTPERPNATPPTSRTVWKRDPRVTGFILVAVGLLGVGASFAFSCDGRWTTTPGCRPVIGWPLLMVFQAGSLINNNGIPTSVGVLGGIAVAFVGVGLLVFGRRPGS